MEKNPYETKTIWFKVTYAGGPYHSFSCEIPDEWDEREFAEAAINIIDKISPSTQVRLER